jgi:putative ABC transport system substrate-binding protein
LPKVEAAARVLGKTLIALRASTRNLDVGFEEIKKAKPDALLVSGSPAFTSRRHALIALAAQYGLPASYDQRVFVEAGGLMSYGTNFSAAYRQAGFYAGRILKGERPSELPVLQPTTFELAVNLKTAKALGLTVPLTVLARAEEVIE